MFKILLVAGARPNFIKVAPVIRALRKRGSFEISLIHTGQHYDDEMSGAFFRVLGIPEADENLGVGSASQSVQTARIMERFEPVILRLRPRAILVFGDVNSTMACSLVASKLLVPVVHVEAGLRSFDREMPEEINRLVTDQLSDLMLVSEPSGTKNLLAEGRPRDAIREVGNVMIDSLKWVIPRIKPGQVIESFALREHEYGLVTLHRPSNVDDPEVLSKVLRCLGEIADELPLVFPVHPRTRSKIESLDLKLARGLYLVPPVSYAESIALQHGAKVVLTDSGGIQEETSAMAVPCLTLRFNTERPVTVDSGTSTLVGNDPGRIWEAYERVRSGTYKKGQPIPLWDGMAAERVAAEIEAWLISGHAGVAQR